MDCKHVGRNALYLVFYYIKLALSGKQDQLVWDETPTADSTNAISSGAVRKAIDEAMGGGGGLGNLDAILAELVGGG